VLHKALLNRREGSLTAVFMRFEAEYFEKLVGGLFKQYE
jgi:hypothetical protein